MDYSIESGVMTSSNDTIPQSLDLSSNVASTVIPNAHLQPITDSTVGKVFVGIFLSFVIFMSIFGNILVCLAVYTDRNLRKIGNLFVVSLAIADLFVAILVMTFALVNDLLGYWPFGDQYCDTWIAFDVMCSTASILNLCAISLDRYIHIKDPLRYGRWITKKIVTSSIAAIWLVSALVSFLPISLDLHQPKNGMEETSDDQQCALDLSPTFAVVSSCISFFFPCLVMFVLYSRLFLYAKKHVASIKAQVRPVTLGSLEGDNTRPKKVAAPYHVSESKAATTVGIIVGTFLACWVPFFCVNIVAAFCKTCISPDVFKVLTWCGYTNSSFNPIIYSIFNQEFREAFRRILRLRCHAHRVVCCRCLGTRRSHLEYYAAASTTAGGVVVEATEPSCCPSFSSCCSACTCYCYCCSCCCLPDELDARHTRRQRYSGGSESFLQLPHKSHQNGSPPSVGTEYKELDIAPTPRLSYDRSRRSSGEHCLILEQVSAI